MVSEDAERTAAPAGALNGLRVLDLGHGIAGPYAARLLGDLGAQVIKIEPPSGDFARGLAPFADDDAGVHTSLLFTYLNWNKRGVVLDLGSREAPGRLKPLVQWADIIIESFSPGRMAEWGFGFDVLTSWNPRLVLTSISNFGQSGPRAKDAASDLIFYALSGLSSISGFADPYTPIKHGLRQSLYGAGMTTAYGALAGHRLARLVGTAQHVDVSIHECLVSEMVTPLSYYAFAGAVQGRHPKRADPLDGLPLRAAEGFVAFQVNDRAPLSSLAMLLGDPSLADPQWSVDEYRVRQAHVLREILEKSLATRPAVEWFVDASERRVLAGLVQGAEELLRCKQLESRHALRTVPRQTSIRFPVELAHLTRTPVSVRSPAPYLGEHNTEIMDVAAAGDPPDAGVVDRPVELGPPGTGGAVPSAATAGPLAGLVVLELAGLVSVPYVGALLSDLGAEVIKVEGPQRPDALRHSFGPFFDNEPGDLPWNRCGAFHMLNRGKRSLVCDMKSDEGRAILRRLVERADILIENFATGVLGTWGLSPEEAVEINPRLIALSNTGFGSSGPWGSYKAQGTTLEVTMGAAAYTGYRDGDPLKAGQSYPDFLACWSAMLAIFAALADRDRTGRGQWIDQGMYQLGPAVIPEAMLGPQAGVASLERQGAEDLDTLLSGVFATRVEGQWLALSIPDATAACCLAHLIPELTAVDSDRASSSYMAASQALQQWLLGMDADAAAAVLVDAGIAAGRVMNARDLFFDEHLRARGFFEPMEFDAAAGGHRMLIGRPFRFTELPEAARIRGRAPDFGADNAYVLQMVAGFESDELAALVQSPALASTPLTFPAVRPTIFADLIEAGRFETQDQQYQLVDSHVVDGQR